MLGRELEFDRRIQRQRLASIAGFALGVLLVAAAFGIGRWSATGPAGGGQRSTASRAEPGPGPARLENGVPVGYARTQEGAVAAATNFITVVDGPLMPLPDRYRRALDTLAAPGARAAAESDAARAMGDPEGMMTLMMYAEEGRFVVCRAVPLAFRVEQYDDRHAQVSIWVESFIAVDGAVAPRETWSTITSTVVWDGTDWKLQGLDRFAGGGDGPVPVVTQAPAGSSSLPAQMKEFTEYRPATPLRR